jgi:hypothetical protein
MAALGNLSSNLLPTRAAALADLAERLTQAAADHGEIDIISRPLADGTVWSAVVHSNGYSRVETKPDGTLRLSGGSGGSSGGFESQRAAARADLRSCVERECSRCGKVCAYGPGPQGTGAEIALYLVGTTWTAPFYVCMACDAKADAVAWARGAVPGGAADAHVMRVWGAGPEAPVIASTQALVDLVDLVDLADGVAGCCPPLGWHFTYEHPGFFGQILTRGTFASKEFDRLYAVWICARWDAGDPWVRSIWISKPEVVS